MNENFQTPLDANELQKRTMIEQVAEAAVRKFALDHPEITNPVPPPEQHTAFSASVKLAGSVFGALLVAGIGGVAIWGISSVNDMQKTLARIDERQLILAPIEEKRFANLETSKAAMETRISVLEQRGGNRAKTY